MPAKANGGVLTPRTPGPQRMGPGLSAGVRAGGALGLAELQEFVAEPCVEWRWVFASVPHCTAEVQRREGACWRSL